MKPVPYVAVLSITLSLATMPTRAATLEEAVAVALESNPGLHAATHRVAAARAAHDQVKAAWFPRITATGHYARTDNPTQAFMMDLNQRSLDLSDPAFNPNRPDDTDNLRFGVGVHYRLLDGGQRRAQTRMTDRTTSVQQFRERAVQNELIYEVTRAYYHALHLRAALDVQQETVKSLEESLRVAQARLDAGSALRTDVLNLDVQVAQARDEHTRTRNGLELAVAALNASIGADLVTTSTLSVPEQKPDAPAETEPDQAVENRPEYQAARELLAVQRHNIGRAQSAYAPTVSAFGSMDWDSDVSRDYEQSYLVGIKAEWDLFDGFRRSGAVAEARAQQEEAAAQLARLRNELTLDLKQARIREQDASERVRTAARITETAEESLRLTQERYEQGAANITELLNAHVAHSAARMREESTHFEVYTARANMERALGLPKGKE